MIDNIMIFAAGKGSRMGELGKEMPKSLITISDKPILYYVLELVITYPFKKIIINSHHLNEQLEESIELFKQKYSGQADIIIIHEEELLETGGAIKNAKFLLGNKPIFTINADSIIESDINIFQYMQEEWDEQKMNFLLLLQDFNKVIGYKGNGDFELSEDGKLSRSKDINIKMSKLYSGISLLKPEIFYEYPSKIFSLKELFFNDPKVYGAYLENSILYHATNIDDVKNIELKMQAR